LLADHFYIFLTSLLLGAVALLFLSRYLWNHLLDFLMALGMAFLIVGLTGLVCKEGIPAYMANGLVIAVCFLLAMLLLTLTRIALVHVVFNKWLRRHFRRQVVIAGSDSEADRIARYIVDHNAPFWVVGTVGPGSSCGLDNNLGKRCLGDINKIPAIASQFKIDDIIITDEDIDKPTLVSLLDFCTSAGINAWFPPKLLSIINIKLNIDNFCGLPMIRLCSQKNTWLFSKIKHSVDALITLPMFILQLPLFLLIALAVKLESPGPVFYRAQAVGKNGRVFTMYKFRSMRVDSGNEIHKDYVTKLIKGEIENGKDEDKPLKITDDPRVTRVGNILRKLSLDELPQLINVIKGDMSLVGPRPCLPYEFEVYQDWYKRRVSVRAGISGLWQVTGRSEVSFEDMILLDLYYIYNRSLVMDFNILFETIFVVLGKKGAY
jgi:undecaprenyl-phosphate galactose phosphotransferase